jgi:O-antigen ligase
MVSNFTIIPFFALLLSGNRNWVAWLVQPAGAIVVISTVSRAALGLCLFGMAVTYLVLALHRFTRQRAAIGIISVLGLLAISPLALNSFDQRFSRSPLSEDYGEREALVRSAQLMLTDHPWGVGANHYLITAKFQGYADAAGVYPAESNRNTHVHNTYWLTASELGYFGVAAFILMMLHPLVVAFRCGWRNAGDQRGAVLIGFGSALLVLDIHNFYEWIFVSAQLQYYFALIVGQVAGLALQLEYRQPQKSPQLESMLTPFATAH